MGVLNWVAFLLHCIALQSLWAILLGTHELYEVNHLGSPASLELLLTSLGRAVHMGHSVIY